MTQPALPVEIDAALTRLKRAADACRTAGADSAEAGRELAGLRDALAESEAECERLRAALADAENRRAQALRQIDAAATRVDALIADAGGTGEDG